MIKIMDLTGKRFSRLKVVSRAQNDKYGGAQWLCLCDCGGSTIVAGGALKGKRTKSCGCYNREQAAIRLTTHGLTQHPLFKIWCGMRKRCRAEKSDNYKYYGGRGIKVCNAWQKFEPFYLWSISSGYKKFLTIDRVNPEGDYSPDNCRWATWGEQQRNKRNSIKIKNPASGESHCAAEWSRRLGGNKSLVSLRLSAGWPEERAITEGVRTCRVKNF